MKKDVFITGLASFFPNSPVSNDGKGHNQGSKRLKNKDQDAGLTQFNTAK